MAEQGESASLSKITLAYLAEAIITLSSKVALRRSLQ